MNSIFHLKSSSLSNTIFICIIISTFSGCLVLVSHYQNLLISKLEFSEELINNNNSAFNYFLENYDDFKNEEIELDIFDNGIKSIGRTKKWGFCDVLISKTIFKNDTILKSALIGKSTDFSNKLALFVTDYDKILKLSGKSVITGDIKVPSGIIERGYLNNKEKTNITIYGSQLKSKDILPRIDKQLNLDLYASEMLTLNDFESKTIFNDFKKETLIINVSDITQIDNLELKGNIILFSRGSLSIGETNTIEDILIVAPSVIIASNFIGNMQIVSKKKVEINANVLLKYPSSIYVENDLDSIIVIVKEGAKIAGGIVINGNTYNGSLKRQLIIEPNSLIVGDVYCYGKTQLQGEIRGTIYTDRFFLKTKSAENENSIHNCNINRDNLPENFVRLPLFKNENSKYEVIKEF